MISDLKRPLPISPRPDRAGDEAAGTDRERLEAFVEHGDEFAFERLVEKYRRLAFSAALRRCGQRELAEEAMQNAFAVLARKAKQLIRHPTLSGWVHRTAMLEASTLVRAERTRRRKHVELMEHEHLRSIAGTRDESPELVHLEEGLARLASKDRDVILMRFYEGLSFDEIAARIGQSNAACQKRSGRAVEKLSRLLQRTGTNSAASVACLSTLSTRLAEATPLATSGAITKIALAGSAEVTLATLIAKLLTTMNHTKLIGTAAITLALLIPIRLQSDESKRLEQATAEIRSQIEELENRTAGAVRNDASLATMDPPPKGRLTAIRKTGLERPEAPQPRDRVARAMGNLKRQEIFYIRKYADGIPEPEDPNYAEYVAEMDGFMRLFGREMAILGENQAAIKTDREDERAAFCSDILSAAIDCDDATAAKIGELMSARLEGLGDFFGDSNKRPEDPALVPEWKEQNERVLGGIWDELHALLGPDDQSDFELGFPRHTIIQRSFNIGFPGGGEF